MTIITVTEIGPNSTAIKYSESVSSPSAGMSMLIDAVQTWMVGNGWELYDLIAGVNQRVYRCLNQDGQTYKYLLLDFNNPMALYTKVYENWNPSSHTGTNMCYYSGDTYQRFDWAFGGYLYIFGSSRYMMFMSRISSTNAYGDSSYRGAQGCMEVTRDNPSDTVAAGYPTFGYINTGFAGLNKGYCGFSFPRIRTGHTGINAANPVSLVSLGTGTVYSSAGYPCGAPTIQPLAPPQMCPWENKPPVCQLHIAGFTATYTVGFKGRPYGLKALSGAAGGGVMDTVSIPCDAGGFVNAAGTSVDHWTLPAYSDNYVSFVIPK